MYKILNNLIRKDWVQVTFGVTLNDVTPLNIF